MKTRERKRHLISPSVGLTVLCSLICVTSPELVAAPAPDPNFYYYSSGRKNALALSKERLAVRFRQGLTLEQQKAVVESEQGLGAFSQRVVSPTFRLAFLPLRGGLTEENVIATQA